MKLQRTERDFYTLSIVPTPAVSGTWQASFDGGTVWVDGQSLGSDKWAWLVAGPDFDAAAVGLDPLDTDSVVYITHAPLLRVEDSPVLDVQRGPTISLWPADGNYELPDPANPPWVGPVEQEHQRAAAAETALSGRIDIIETTYPKDINGVGGEHPVLDGADIEIGVGTLLPAWGPTNWSVPDALAYVKLLSEQARTDGYLVNRLDRKFADAKRLGGGIAVTEYADSAEITEDWASQANVVAAANGQVSGNRWYADNAAAPGGWTKAVSFPATGNWRFTTLYYHKAGGASSAYIGFSTAAPGTPVAAGEPTAAVIGVGGGSLRNAVVGSTLTGAGVTVQGGIILGSNPAADTTYLVTIEASTNWITFMLKAVGTTLNAYSFRLSRAAMATAGLTAKNLYCYITDVRGLAGSAFGPWNFQTLTQQPPRTKVLGGQAIDGSTFRLSSLPMPVSGLPALYALPANYDPRKPAPLVLWAHQTVTGTSLDPWEETRLTPVTQALLDAGYIVAALSSPDGYGGTVESAQYLELLNYLRSRYNIGPYFWYGASGGGLTALNAIGRRDFPTPAGAALVGSAISLSQVYALGAPWDTAIRAVYGIAPDGSDYAAKTAGFDPNLRVPTEMRNVPLRFYTSTGDTTQPPSIQEAYKTSVGPYVPECDIVYGTGGHLDPSQYQPSDLLAFFARHL